MSIKDKVAGLAGKAMKGVHAGDDKLAIRALGGGRAIHVESPAFGDGAPIPRKYAAEGAGTSPPLHWDGVPANARELVLLVEDPDAPMPSPYVHWTMRRIAPELHDVAEGTPAQGASEGKNSAMSQGWTGPNPPPKHGVHHYHFELFALDAPLDVDEHPSRDALVKAMRGHVLAAGDLVGTYERT